MPPHLQSPLFHRGARSSSLALDVQGAGELLCLIPGSDLRAATSHPSDSWGNLDYISTVRETPRHLTITQIMPKITLF